MTVTGSKRILVADDNDTARRALTRYLGSHRDFEICGEAVDCEEAIEKAWELKPDLILLDVVMPRTNGIVAASVLKDLLPNVRIILFTMYADAMARAFPRTGLAADAVISKGEGMQKLADCVHSLLA
jgi:DNA-binding NarL/FixJ family response regulator